MPNPPEYNKRYYQEHRDTILARNKAYNKKHRNRLIALSHGVSLEFVEELRAKQDGQCAICGHKAKLHIDHNHETGKVRGLLCVRCNTGLGRFKDNLSSLFQAILYLQSNR